MRHFQRAALIIALGGLTTPAAAQLTPARPQQPRSIRTFIGGGGAITQPIGQFADYVGVGGGGVGTFSQGIDRRGILSIRADFAYLVYGHEHRQIPFPTAPRVQLDLNTYNSILHGAIGPELSAVSGPIRPYVAGQVGFVYLFTESSLSGTDNSDSFASTPNYRFTHISWIGSGGVLIPLHTSKTPVSIDLGAHYLYNGQARYLTPGDIHEDNNGNVTYSAHHSDANLIMYRIGVRVGVT